MGTIIAYIVTGAIIGALGRLILPGKQNISMVMTVVLGILGALIGGYITQMFAYKNASGGIPWIAVLVGALVAAGLIALYGNLVGRKQLR